MDKLGGITARRAVVGIVAVIVAGGIVVGLASSLAPAPAPYGSADIVSQKGFFGLAPVLNVLSGAGTTVTFGGGTQVIGNNGTTFETTTTTLTGSVPLANAGNTTQGLPGGSGGLIEFSSQVTLQSPSPQQAASGVVALAYSSGGYVAYQSTYPSSANVVIRVPAADYQQVLAKVEALGTVEALTSNSNDVSVKYTDLNATLASLQTEQAALLRLLNSSTSVNSTLAIESQLQGVNQQINEVESQILQTRTLIEYATIQVTVTQAAQAAPLTMTLSATPKYGQAPLSVTFNAVVKGGAQPYVVNYNFGDGSASQGQIVIHSYYQPGQYNVTATATDQNGTSAEQWVLVRVSAPPGQSGLATFIGTVSGLFVNVVEGIAEVAVVVLPIAAVGAAVVIPLQKRSRSQKAARQSQ
ncbi:MAG: DUF4349 domain-containing protein [Nitrososphaerota archaeon]|nr:DUF4349 domain-containing protein [Nitrososphaerota archaeon]